jgi:hypothetical protein
VLRTASASISRSSTLECEASRLMCLCRVMRSISDDRRVWLCQTASLRPTIFADKVVLPEAFGSRQTTPLHEPEVKARSLATGQDDIPSQTDNKLKEASLQRGLILICEWLNFVRDRTDIRATEY